jgi:predicted ferric reductase
MPTPNAVITRIDAMKFLLGGLLAIVTFVWGWELFSASDPVTASLPWVIRQQGLYLSGLASIALMSLAMLLATRPVWLERPMGGLDRIYRAHKWAGILAIGFAAAHWLIEMSDDVLKALIGREGRLPKEKYSGLFEVLRKLAEDMGEWAIYAVLAMLVLTLWKRFPYRLWRYLHRVMPVLYLMLAFHAAMLAPRDYWTQPVGMLLALLLVGGSLSSLLSLLGLVGRNRQVSGSVLRVNSLPGDITEVTCQLDRGWRGHRPGQFAFLTFDRHEGAHPFTIASADCGDRMVTFQIKALGDYTRGLAQRLQIGQPLRLEGPYGRFDLTRHNPQAQQIWIAGGIGVTPFLAWLESLQGHPEQAPVADLHYCTRDLDNDVFVARLEALCATLPGVHLHVHGSAQGEVLQVAALRPGVNSPRRAEVWFCGPQGLAESLKTGLQSTWGRRCHFHQEAFEMR